MLLILLLALPLLGVLWFINLVNLLEHLHNEKKIQKQMWLGAMLTLIFLFVFVYGFTSIIG